MHVTTPYPLLHYEVAIESFLPESEEVTDLNFSG
jgi:hypothetical protein